MALKASRTWYVTDTGAGDRAPAQVHAPKDMRLSEVVEAIFESMGGNITLDEENEKKLRWLHETEEKMETIHFTYLRDGEPRATLKISREPFETYVVDSSS